MTLPNGTLPDNSNEEAVQRTAFTHVVSALNVPPVTTHASLPAASAAFSIHRTYASQSSRDNRVLSDSRDNRERRTGLCNQKCPIQRTAPLIR